MASKNFSNLPGEWSGFAFAPEKVGAHLLDLLGDMPQYGEQAA